MNREADPAFRRGGPLCRGLRQDSEKALDTPWVADAHLNVRPLVEAGRRVDRRTFHEGAAHAVERGQARPSAGFVEVFDDRAVKESLHEVGAAPVLWRTLAGERQRAQQVLVSLADQ